ncbi:MAG: tetratricopeptide repeat protein [Bacteroidia bacterium]|nr:tetratricopeptide repeat protein [Bacteroidia bacterium]
MMSTKFIGISILSFVIVIGCTTDPKEKARESISELEAQMSADTNQAPNRQLAVQAIQAYIDFAEKYPDDAQSTEYYFMAGKISMSLNMGSQAIMYFNRVETKYAESPQAPMAIFMQAFVYETIIGNTQKAGEYYKKFISKYPNHEFTDDAQISLEQLGKPMEQIIREIEAKNKKDSGTVHTKDTVI